MRNTSFIICVFFPISEKRTQCFVFSHDLQLVVCMWCYLASIIVKLICRSNVASNSQFLIYRVNNITVVLVKSLDFSLIQNLKSKKIDPTGPVVGYLLDWQYDVSAVFNLNTWICSFQYDSIVLQLFCRSGPT